MEKVIVIGMQRTGTTTLGQALIILGYNVVATVKGLDKYLLTGDKSKAIEIASQYDAFQDLPWIFLYKDLDEKFPNSKFILTIRDEESWLKSMLNHFGDSNTNMRKWAYGAGTPKHHEDLYLKAFRNHHKDVLDYFKDRQSDLLILRTGKDFSWSKICEFLSLPIPNRSFPYENKNSSNYSWIEKIRNRLIGKIPKTFRRKLLVLLGKKKRLDRFHTDCGVD